jgi:pSer/pThr/pTyr-binding forkhead associated (FHA) protein
MRKKPYHLARASESLPNATWIDNRGVVVSPPARRSFFLGSSPERNRHVLQVRIKLTVTDGGLKGEEYVFNDSARWVLGRSADCDIALPTDMPISRRHCTFEIDPPTVRVRDLNSRNGTYVNGERIGQRSDPLARGELDHEGETRELRDGDVVRVGCIAIRVSVDVFGLVPMTSGPVAENRPKGCFGGATTGAALTLAQELSDRGE